jgi:hypothetical protein
VLGNRDKHAAGVAELQAQVTRLAALPLAGLGSEVMSSVFGASAPGADGSALTITTAANEFITDSAAWCNDDATREQLVEVVGEGLQVLEHACLVGQQVVLVGNEHWALGWKLTRTGAAALAQGTVAQALGG